MQESTEITQEINRIKALDDAAMMAADSAKENMQLAVDSAKIIGAELETLKNRWGAKRFDVIINSHFSDSFKQRSKVYRKAAKDDPRQFMLGIGILPEKEKQSKDGLIKPDPFFGWINKINGHVRSTKRLGQAERIALKGLMKQIERVLDESM